MTSFGLIGDLFSWGNQKVTNGRSCGGPLPRSVCRIWRIVSGQTMLQILLMVQKSCCHQLRLVVYPHYLRVFFYLPGGDRRISEPSTVAGAIYVLRGSGWQENEPSKTGTNPVSPGIMLKRIPHMLHGTGIFTST